MTTTNTWLTPPAGALLEVGVGVTRGLGVGVGLAVGRVVGVAVADGLGVGVTRTVGEGVSAAGSAVEAGGGVESQTVMGAVATSCRPPLPSCVAAPMR